MWIVINPRADAGKGYYGPFYSELVAEEWAKKHWDRYIVVVLNDPNVPVYGP